MNEELFAQLVESVNQMKAIRSGRVQPSRVIRERRGHVIDVAELRGEFGLNQHQFAALLGISVDTLQNWEQGRRSPDGPAKVLLRVAATHPEALLAVSAGYDFSPPPEPVRVAEPVVKYPATDPTLPASPLQRPRAAGRDRR